MQENIIITDMLIFFNDISFILEFNIKIEKSITINNKL